MKAQLVFLLLAVVVGLKAAFTDDESGLSSMCLVVKEEEVAVDEIEDIDVDAFFNNDL